MSETDLNAALEELREQECYVVALRNGVGSNEPRERVGLSTVIGRLEQP